MISKPFNKARAFNLILILLIVMAIVPLSTSCTDSDDDPTIIETYEVSLYDLNKDIIRVNVTNTATGLQAVYNTMLPDSTSRAHLTQDFVNGARFFEDNSGYHFIETLDDAWVVAHINPDWIGTSRINAQDLNGKYHVQEIVNTVANIGFGFVEYQFVNPASGQGENKMSFVTRIPTTEWFIGAGVYNNTEEPYYEPFDASKLLVREITQTLANGMAGVLDNYYSEEADRVAFFQNFTDHIRFFDDQSGYFFVFEFDGLCLAHGVQDDLEGQDLWDLQDSQGNYVTRGLSEAAQSDPDGGYYDYYWTNPSTGEDEPKTAYVVQIPGTDIFIGSGVYRD